MGAFADSGYEYLLKQWLMTSRSETKIRDLCTSIFSCYDVYHSSFLSDLQSSNSIIETLLYVTPNREILYVTDVQMRKVLTGETAPVTSHPSGAFEHLSCFLPGLLALGVHTLDLSPSDKELHSWAAEGLGYSCWLSYADQLTGLGPDIMTMTKYSNASDGLWLPKVEKWREDGRHGRPPGLREPGPTTVKGSRDYKPYKKTYLLRPEVCLP